MNIGFNLSPKKKLKLKSGTLQRYSLTQSRTFLNNSFNLMQRKPGPHEHKIIRAQKNT